MLLSACEPFATVEQVKESDCACEWPQDAELEELIDEASDLLAWASNYRYLGRCTRTVYPCKQRLDCRCSCGCNRVGGIELPGVNPTVTSVTLNGDALAAGTDYEVSEGKLYRLGAVWPSNANISGGPTLAVVYAHGQPVRTFARLATADLVCYLQNVGERRRTELSKRAKAAIIDGVNIDLETIGPYELDLLNLPDVARFVAIFRQDSGSTFWAPELEPVWVT